MGEWNFNFTCVMIVGRNLHNKIRNSLFELLLAIKVVFSYLSIHSQKSKNKTLNDI